MCQGVTYGEERGGQEEGKEERKEEEEGDRDGEQERTKPTLDQISNKAASRRVRQP